VPDGPTSRTNQRTLFDEIRNPRLRASSESPASNGPETVEQTAAREQTEAESEARVARSRVDAKVRIAVRDAEKKKGGPLTAAERSRIEKDVGVQDAGDQMFKRIVKSEILDRARRINFDDDSDGEWDSDNDQFDSDDDLILNGAGLR
jgi:hypothetical protein